MTIISPEFAAPAVFIGEEESRLLVKTPTLEGLETLFAYKAPDLASFIPHDYVPEVLPPSGEKLNIQVNKDHAYGVLDTLMNAYARGGFPYSQDRVRLPHDPRHMPKTMPRGGIEHAMFLFNICYYMRGGIKSVDAVKRMANVYDARPDLFDAYLASFADEQDVVDILKRNGLGFQKTAAKQWVENSKRLVADYDGDPRKIFDDTSTYEVCAEKIRSQGKKGFKGFQYKMASMLTYYLMDEELVEPFNFPIPVDLHVMRVSIANEMITFPGIPQKTNLFTDETTATLRKLYFDYAEENGVNPLRLCDAVWLLSESSCGMHPGNTTIEPLGRKLRNGRSTYLIPKVVATYDPKQQAAYNASCAQCPIEPTCKFNIPGTQYYVGGNLIIRGERVRFPRTNPASIAVQESLFS